LDEQKPYRPAFKSDEASHVEYLGEPSNLVMLARQSGVSQPAHAEGESSNYRNKSVNMPDSFEGEIDDVRKFNIVTSEQHFKKETSLN